jgi:small-conductance mechanosensitive channel
MDASLRLALIKTVRTLLLILAVLFALPAVGIDLTVLSVFGGALGVGLGLGLQKIASNYVSGFIILLDRSIRPGDMITVGTSYGEVSQLNTRYTLLRSLDGTEIIIPNENLLTSTVINHSFTKRDVRIKLPIQISYESDVEHVREILKTIALDHPRVLKTEGYTPVVLLTEFAASGINLELGIWIDDPEDGQGNLRSELNLAIWQAFQREGISIPYPRSDIHLIPALEKAG